MFVVFFSGEQARIKILKICEAFGASCYPVPEDISKQRQIIREVSMFALGLIASQLNEINDFVLSQLHFSGFCTILYSST